MSAYITRTEPLGNGQVQVWGTRPGSAVGVQIIVGLDRVADGTVYTLLDIALTKLDKKAADLDRQSTLDSEAD